MHQDVTCYGCRLQPRGLCVRWRPSPPPQKGGGAPKFSAHVYCFFGVLVWRFMPAPRFTICVLVIIEFGLNILLNPVTLQTLFVLKNRLQYVHSYCYRNIF